MVRGWIVGGAVQLLEESGTGTVRERGLSQIGVDGGTTDRQTWRFHLGSTSLGCESNVSEDE